MGIEIKLTKEKKIFFSSKQRKIHFKVSKYPLKVQNY